MALKNDLYDEIIINRNVMGEFIKEYENILGPITIAVIGGIFGLIKLLLKKGKKGVSQIANKINESSFNQIGGDITINGNINIEGKTINKK